MTTLKIQEYNGPQVMAGNEQQAPIRAVVEIPGYKILKVLGKGGMAIVYLAIQESIGRHVALKILAPDHSDETFSDRFLREARIISQLAHPNIITIYDAGVQQTYHYMAMEYIAGKNLTEARDGLSRKLKVDIIKQIAQALDYAGRKGYVHRDIKPENIMLHEDGRAILTDFGIARGKDVKRALTQTGKAIGTPYFMSPEQTKGLEVDHRSDIYSLGVVLYQAIAGRVPFDGSSIVEIGIKHISEPIPALPPGMEIFQPIINKCMSKEPAHRFQTASELYQALHAIPEAQLDYIDAKARAMKNASASHATQLLSSQPSVELLADSASRSATGSATRDAVPRMRAQRVSKPVDITRTDEFKRLRRRNRNWLLLLLLMALGAAGYYQKAVLISLWQQHVQPLVAQYLPQDAAQPSVQNTAPATAAAKPAGTAAAPAAPAVPAQAANPATGNDVTAPAAQEKSAQDVIADVQMLKDKLRINPDDATARQDLVQARHWFRDKLEAALAKKDVDGARQILDATQKAFPRAGQLPAFSQIEKRIDMVDQFNAHMEQARVYMATNAVAKPAGANALEQYLAAARIDPHAPEVREGLQHVAQYYFTKAREARTQNKISDAIQYTATGLQAVNDDPALLALQTELKTDVRQAQTIAHMLQDADAMMRNNQVLDPVAANAYKTYREILRRAPNNPDALAGLQQVQLWLTGRIQALYDKQEYLPARELASRARSAFPKSAAFAPLQKKIDKAIDSTYPNINHIEFAATPVTSISGSSRLDKLAPGQTLYAGFTFKNFYDAQTVLTARLKDSNDTQVYDQQQVTVSGRKGQGFFALRLPNPGSSNGSYNVEIFMNNARILKATLSGLH